MSVVRRTHSRAGPHPASRRARHRIGGEPLTQHHRQDPDPEAPGTPVSNSSVAVLRIGADLDVDTVLRGVASTERPRTDDGAGEA